MAFGVDPTGFIIKTQEEIEQSLKDGFVTIYGPGFTAPEGSKEQQQITMYADALSEVWEMGAEVYHSSDLYQAEGVRLDQIGGWNGGGLRDPGDNDDTYRKQLASPTDNASNLTEDLAEKVQGIPGTTLVYVIENSSDVTDPETGLPSHSFAVVVDGGDDETIADTIWSSQPTGIGSVGNQLVKVIDSVNGFCRTVSFSRPDFKPVTIEYTVTTFETVDNCGTPTETQIAEAAAQILTDWKVGRGTLLYLSQVRGAAACQQGVNVTGVQMSIGGSPVAAADIPLAYFEVATFDAGDITVNII